MTGDDSAELISHAIGRLAIASALRRAALAASLSLSASDVLALELLEHRDDMTPSELAHALHLSSGGTTAVIDRLTRDDLIARSAGPNSRRRVLVWITARGRSAIAKPRRADIDDLAAALRPIERAQAEELLTRLADSAERSTDRLLADAEAVPMPGVPVPGLWA